MGHHHGMADPAPARPLIDLLDTGDTVMLMTMIGDEHSSRPMTIAGVADDRLDLLVDTTTEWTSAVAAGRAITHVTSSDVRTNRFVALNGTATVSRDRTEVERLWNPGAAAFFEGKDDPNLAALHFQVADGQYWDSANGRIGSLIAMVKAAVGGDEQAGDHGSVTT
jgi:general stress protein 26